MRIRGDDLKMRATTIVMFVLCSSAAFADIDYNLSSTVRSYPLSGIVEADIGYDFLLWGTKTAGSAMYGFVRPNIDLGTAGYYNSAMASVDFYPLSFLGGRVGGEAQQNDKDYTAYDCNTYLCRGRFDRSFAQADLTVGAGRYFAQARWKRERWTLGSPNSKQFIESTSGLSLDGMGDSLTTYRGAVGAKIYDKWSVSGVIVYHQSDATREVARFPFVVLRYENGPYSFGIGGGVYSSTIQQEGGSALVFLKWNIKPSLALN